MSYNHIEPQSLNNYNHDHDYNPYMKKYIKIKYIIIFKLKFVEGDINGFVVEK